MRAASAPVPGKPGTARRRDVLFALVKAEIHDSRDLTLTGLVKWLLEPLVYMGMYFLLVGVILERGQRAYPLFLLCALLPWRYVQGVSSSGMVLVSGYGNIISTRVLPRRLLPLVTVITEGLNFVVALVLLAPLLAYYRIGPTVAILWLPVVVGVLALLVSGPTYLVAVFGLYFPDLRGAAQSLVRVGLLASTALVPARRIPGDILPKVIEANPVSGIFDSFRDIFMFGRAPEFWHLAYPSLVGIALLGLGLLLYGAREHQFAKEV